MKEISSIKEVAELFHVAPSALRYWDDAGLIRFERGEDNNYRIPDFHTLLDICDVLFYRGLSLPVKDIKRIPAMDTAALGALLRQNGEVLERELEAIRASIGRLRAKQALLDRLEALKAAGLVPERASLPAIRPFSFGDAQTVRDYADNPSLAFILLDPAAPDAPYYGIASGEKAPSPERLYLKGLFRGATERLDHHDGSLFWKRARELGYTPGLLTGRYLASACEDQRYDYYEGWLELL